MITITRRQAMIAEIAIELMELLWWRHFLEEVMNHDGVFDFEWNNQAEEYNKALPLEVAMLKELLVQEVKSNKQDNIGMYYTI